MSKPEALLRECEAYAPPTTKRPDFDAFWQGTLHQALAVPLAPRADVQEYPTPYAKVYDITYAGFDETRIHGWFVCPAFPGKERRPCLIQYHGFGGSRGAPAGLMHWVMMGLCVLSVDCREQGGITGNSARYTGGGLVRNVVSKGILHKDEYYYRAVYMDCLKAIDFAESRPEVDPAQIFLRGSSQGGSLAMAVAALDGRAKAAIANVPGNSDLVARLEGRSGSFAAVNDYLRKYPQHLETAYETLSYFDTMNLADRITCPVFASVALADTVCPAKLYYATYNRITAEKQITVYPFNGHDDAGHIHLEREMRYIAGMCD